MVPESNQTSIVSLPRIHLPGSKLGWSQDGSSLASENQESDPRSWITEMMWLMLSSVMHASPVST